MAKVYKLELTSLEVGTVRCSGILGYQVPFY